MLSKIKKLDARGVELDRTFKTALRERDAATAYTAATQYKQNLEAQKSLAQQIPDNSRAADKASRMIGEQECRYQHMASYDLKANFTNGDLQEGLDQLAQKSSRISEQMSTARTKGDTESFDRLRNEYSENINVQRQMARHMESAGGQPRDTITHQANDILDHDIKMRDMYFERVSNAAQRGKTPKEQDDANYEKYARNVKNDEIDIVRKNGENRIAGMVNGNHSNEEIQRQEEANKRTNAWVESMNR